MKAKRDAAIFSVIYILSYAAYAIGITQFVPYLTEIGYSPVERGILISSISIVTIIIQVIFGYLSDKLKTVKKLFILIFLLFSGSAFLFYNLEIKNLWVHLFMISMCGGTYNLSMGMGDNWVLESGSYLKKIYSFIRAFGSFGWAIGSVVVAYIISDFGYGSIGITAGIIAVITLVLSLMLKDASKRYDSERKGITKEDIVKLLKNKSYILIVFILFLLNCMMMFNTYTVVDKMMLLGGSNRDVGIFCMIKGAVEIPMFFLGVILVKKYRHTAILFVSAVMYTLQFILFALTNSIMGILIIGFMQMFTNPLFIIASKVLVDELSDESCKSSGQLIAMGVYTGMSALIIPYLSGVMIKAAGVNATLWFAVGVGAIAAILTLRVKMPSSRRSVKSQKEIIKE